MATVESLHEFHKQPTGENTVTIVNKRGHTYAAGTLSRRDAIKVCGAVVASAAMSGLDAYSLESTVTVGDPAHPESLPAALLNAYKNGARDITVTPGTYVLPATGKNTIELRGWSDVTIHCMNSTLIFEDMHRPIFLSGCTNVTIENAKLQFSVTAYAQGRIKAMAEDAKGKYVDWQIDAGYPTNINPAQTTYNVIDQKTRLLKVCTGDSRAGDAMALGPGLYRLRQISGMMNGAAIDDWLVCRVKTGGSIVQLDNSKDCTMKRLTLKNAGFAAFFETGGEGGHRYFDCRVTRGPKPQGATEEQLVSCGADGFHSSGTKIGPTIEHCIWDGVLLDDCIAIHGSLQKVIRATENTLILEKGNDGRFAVNEPVRISSDEGFFGQAMCIAMRTLNAPEMLLELTLDAPLPVPANSKAGNPERCGKSYRIINCILGNTRSRGILVKGDDGLIRGCTIEGCGMSAVSIGPEYFWNEANYSWNVVVEHNIFRHNVLRNSLDNGVIYVHGEGAIGNRNIKIENNKFDTNFGPNMLKIEWTDGVEITNNVFNAPSPLPLSTAGCIVSVHDVRHVTAKGNSCKQLGPSVTQMVKVGKNAEGTVWH